jgi:hypothetical protein
LSQGLDAGASSVDAMLKAKIEKLLEGVDPRTPEDRAKDVEVRERYKDAIVIDSCIPGSPLAYVKNTAETYDALADLSRNKGFTFVSPELGYGSPTQMAEPGDIWGVVRVLEEKHKWSEKEIRGFLGENTLRVYKANWR